MTLSIVNKNFVIGTDNKERPLLELQLAVNRNEKTVTGIASIKKHSHPVIDLIVGLTGECSRIKVDDLRFMYLITLKGDYQTKITLIVDIDFSTGFSNYQFLMPNNEVQFLEFQPAYLLDKYSQFSPQNSWHRVKSGSVPYCSVE